MKEKEGFVFMPSFLEALEALPLEDQKEICWAICTYGIHGAAPEGLSPVGRTVMGLIRPVVDRSKKNYIIAKERGKQGKKGGNPNFQKGKPNPYYVKKDNEDNLGDNLEDNLRDNLDKDMDKDMDKATDREKERDRAMASPPRPRLDDDGTALPGRGTYENVFLSSGEMIGLLKNLPTTWRTYVNQLSDRLYTGEYRGRDHYRAVLDLAEGDILARYGPRADVS